MRVLQRAVDKVEAVVAKHKESARPEYYVEIPEILKQESAIKRRKIKQSICLFKKKKVNEQPQLWHD